MSSKFVVLFRFICLCILFISCKKAEQDIVQYIDVTYKVVDSEPLSLDIYRPDGEEDYPVVVFIHGGGWTKGNKDIVNKGYKKKVKDNLLSNGYGVISIDYRLATAGVVLDQIVSDCKSAIKWIRLNGGDYQLDTSRIGLWGASAGGHLALMTAYAPDSLFMDGAIADTVSTRVDYVVDNFGPTDLIHLLCMGDETDFHNLEIADPKGYQKASEVIVGVLGVDPKNNFDLAHEKALLNSPVTYVSPAIVPTLIMHGSADQVVPLSQSERLNDKRLNVMVSGGYFLYDKLGHGFDGASRRQDKEIVSRITTFINTYSN